MRCALVVLLLLAAACGEGGDGGDDDATAGTTATTTTATTVGDDPGSTTTTAPDPLGGFVPEPLQWDGCGGGVECATLAVPLDWTEPTGATIELAVTRIPAADDAVGGIAVNPGGPGASGNEFIAGGGALDDELTDVFDTISWDPRGLGDSAPLGCADDEAERFVRLETEPDTPEEQATLDAGARAVADHCEEVAGAQLRFVGTDDVARDLEAIRRAYGRPMGYFGISYGTMIGLRHLDLFPGSMLGVVLDGVVDPEDGLTDLLRSQADAFEATIAGILQGCPSGAEGCPDGGGEAAYDELAARLEDGPLAAGDDELRIGDLAAAAIYATYDESSHDVLLDGLGAAQSGDGSVLLDLAEDYRSLVNFDIYQAVSCIDSEHPSSGDAWADFAAEVGAAAPRVGGAVANEMLPCAFWPTPPDPVTGPVVAAGSGPVVVLGTTGDPVTPVHQAEAVAATLADGRFVSVDGESHGGYYISECAREVVAAYFLDGVAPEDGTTC